MRAALGIFLFLFFSSAKAQDTTAVKIPADTTVYCIIGMNDGLLLKGRVVGQNNGEIKFRDTNLGLLTIQVKKIASVETGDSGAYYLLYMKDGSRIHGTIVSQDEHAVELETKSLGSQHIPLERINEIRKISAKDIRRKGKYWFPNMNVSRYFFGPSAIPLKNGSGYYQTVDFLVNNVQYGISKNISIGGGAVLPFGFFIMSRIGYKLKERLYAGAGMIYGSTLVKFRKTNYNFGSFYGMATFGSPNANVTAGIGGGFLRADGITDFFPKPVFMISGMVRISPRIALVGENVIIPVKNTYFNAMGEVSDYNHRNSSIYGFRIMKEKITVDIGLLHLPQEIFKVFPYLDFAIKF